MKDFGKRIHDVEQRVLRIEKFMVGTGRGPAHHTTSRYATALEVVLEYQQICNPQSSLVDLKMWLNNQRLNSEENK